MAAASKKRSHADSATVGKLQRPKKKHKTVPQYPRDSEEDLDNALVDDIASISVSGSDSESDADIPVAKAARIKTGKSSKKSSAEDDSDDHDGADSNDNNGGNDSDDLDEDDDFLNSDDETSNMGSKRPKSKRNDPNAFATSLQKILSTVSSVSMRLPKRSLGLHSTRA